MPSIQLNGLIPSVPDDAIFDEFEAVFLFKTKDAVVDALYNWLGDRIEQWEEANNEKYEEILLTIDITGLDLIDTVGYEWACLEPIMPDRIINYENL